MKEKGDRKPTGMPKELAQGWEGGRGKLLLPVGACLLASFLEKADTML